MNYNYQIIELKASQALQIILNDFDTCDVLRIEQFRDVTEHKQQSHYGDNRVKAMPNVYETNRVF